MLVNLIHFSKKNLVFVIQKTFDLFLKLTMQLNDFQHIIFSLIGFIQFAKRTISLQNPAVKFYQMMQDHAAI